MHPAVWPGALLILISVGRLPELLTFLAPLHVGKIAVLWAVAAIIAGPRDIGNAPVFDQRLARLLVVWFGFAVVSVLWSVWRSYSLGFLFGGLLINMILFFVLARTTTNIRTLRFYAGTLLLAAGLLSVTAARVALTSAEGRIAVSGAYDPNDLAMVLVMLLPLAVAWLFALRGMGRAVMLLLCGVMLVGTLLTGSRGGFLGLVAGAPISAVRVCPDPMGNWVRALLRASSPRRHLRSSYCWRRHQRASGNVSVQWAHSSRTTTSPIQPGASRSGSAVSRR
jgi:hypothetical protein